jgi:glycerophosphoryl diester phosphodiesterase
MIHVDRLVAHRGYQSKYPENTALGLNQAIEAGARFIELDVQFSLDQLPIIYHDTNLMRVSNIDIEISETLRETLLEQSAYEPNRLGDQFIDEKIAPLEGLVDILQRNPQVTAFVEIKDEAIQHCSRELISQTIQAILEPVKGQTVLMSFDYALAVAAREAKWPLVGAVLHQWKDLDDPLIRQAHPDYIYVDHKIIPADFDLESAQQLASCKLVTYEVGNILLAQQLLSRGVDMLETFEIGNLIGSS